MRMIDATEAAAWAYDHILDDTERYAILDFLRECSTVDAVEVVRCGECVHWDAEKLYCHHPAGLSYCEQVAAERGFCCFGERRNGK